MLKEYQLLYLDNDIPINRSFYCNNGDVKSRGLEVHVLDNSQAKDCTGLTIKMIIKVPSGDIFEATVANGLVTVLNAESGIYQVLFPDNMGKGRLIAEIQLSNAVPEVIVSRKFSLVSDGSLTSDGSISALPTGGLLWNVLTNEAQRQADFVEVLGSLDEEVALKYAGLEAEYATKLTGVESQLAERATQNALEVEKARITNLATLAVGSTTGDAELIDARVGTNGLTYANAGSAVREQANLLKDKLLKFKLTNYAENIALSLANEEKTIPVVIASAHNGVLKYSVKNTSVNDGYFRVQFLKGASVIYSKEQLILKNSTTTETVALVDDVDAIYLKNINARTMSVNCWVEYVEDFFKVLNKSDFIVDANGKGDFTTIQAALTFLKSSFDVANIPVRLRIRNGKYTATPSAVYPYYAIDKGANKISIIGESRDGVIINCLCTSALKGLALNIGGEGTVENLTINVLADASLTVESLNTANFRPYCIHNDESPLTVTTDYYTVVKNCKLYNEVYMPVGAGLQNKQTQRYENVECIFKSTLENRQGSLYVHSPSSPTAVANGIEVVDCVLVSYNGATALHLPNVVGSQQYSAIKQTFVRNVTATTGASEVWNPTPNKTIVSKGNSNASLNV